MEKLRWGILATGFIAKRFAEGLATSHSGALHAVSSRRLSSAKAFARTHGASQAFGSHEDLLASSEIDAIYIATPHPYHAELAIAALRAGKNVLCEKPLAMTIAEVESVQRVAREQGRVLMEAYMYRCHPQTVALRDAIRAGKLGRVRLVHASFGFHAPFDKKGRLFDPKLGGGAILDVGGYPASLACMVADADNGGFVEDVTCHGVSGYLDPRCEVDTIAHATLSFGSGLDAQISVSTQLNQENVVRVFGEKAWAEIREPWIVAPHGGDWEFSIHVPGKEKPLKIAGNEPRELYGVEADCFASLVRDGQVDAPCMSEADTLRVNGILESWQDQLPAAANA